MRNEIKFMNLTVINGSIKKQSTSMSINTKESIPMKLKSMNYALLTGLSLCAAGIMTAQAQNTLITFSVDESTNIANGSLVPGVDFVYVEGTFNGWSYPGLQLYQVGNTSVYTNTVDDTAAQDQSDGNVNFIYDDTVNGGEHGGDYQNRMAYLPPGNNASLILPTPYYDDNGPNSTATVTFQIDMSSEILLGHFNPGGGDTVVIAGSFNGWSPTAGPQWVLTNDPTILRTNGAVVTSDVYTATVAITANDDTANGGNSPTNCAQEFKFVEMPEYNWDGPLYPNEDPDSGNRFFAAYSQTLPIVYFNDQPFIPANYVSDSNCMVTFTVDMTGAVGFGDDYVFNASAGDVVCINGVYDGISPNWADWSLFPIPGPIAGLTLSPVVGSSNLWTITLPINKLNLAYLQYKYSINGWDDEAGFADNRNRWIRSMPNYTMPTDVFGSQGGGSSYELSFGNLAITNLGSNQVQLSWLGRNGVELQTASSFNPAAWTSQPLTDGTNLTCAPGTGIASTNYNANQPATYYRLVGPPQ
jgi:hypothetical protein